MFYCFFGRISKETPFRDYEIFDEIEIIFY